MAAGLAAAGVEVVAICEAGAPSSWLRRPAGLVSAPSKLVEGAGYAATLLRSRIPYRPRTVIIRIHGDQAVEAVTIARVDRQGRPVAGTERELAVDLVGLGWGFTPSLELVLAAGAETRVDVDGIPRRLGGRPAAQLAGGRLRGRRGDRGRRGPAGSAGGRARGSDRSGGRRSATGPTTHEPAATSDPPWPRLRPGDASCASRCRSGWSAWLDDDTTVCRCEEVTAGDIRYAHDELGADDQRTVKLLARPGMGWCQGRVCGFATACLASSDRSREVVAADLRPLASRPLCAPVSLGDLADLDDEYPR